MTSLWFIRRADLRSLPSGSLGRIANGEMLADAIHRSPKEAQRAIADLQGTPLRVVVALLENDRCKGFLVREGGITQCFSPGVADIEYLEKVVMPILESAA